MKHRVWRDTLALESLSPDSHFCSQQQIKVKSLENAEKNPKAIDNWIESISELHRFKPPATVHYTR